MTSIIYLLCIALVVILSFLYLKTEKLSRKILDIKVSKVTFESAKVALERLGSWVTWLTGLQTAAMAAMALLIQMRQEAFEDVQKNYAFFVLLFFGASIVLATWLLSSIPSVQQRLIDRGEPVEQNDIYRMEIFSFIPYTIGRFSGIVHTYFLIGVVFFALFVFSLF